MAIYCVLIDGSIIALIEKTGGAYALRMGCHQKNPGKHADVDVVWPAMWMTT